MTSSWSRGQAQFPVNNSQFRVFLLEQEHAVYASIKMEMCGCIHSFYQQCVDFLTYLYVYFFALPLTVRRTLESELYHVTEH